MKRRALATVLFLLFAAGFTGGAWWYAYSSALDQMAERGRADLSLASDRLVGQLQQFRELAVLMADHPTLKAALLGAGGGAAPLLERTADKTGAMRIHLALPSGQLRASSAGAQAPASLAGQPAFARAMQGALGAQHGREGEEGRVYAYAAPVFGPGGRLLGAVVVAVDLRALEGAWAGDAEAVFFTDEAGVVFVSNRTELLFRSLSPGPGAAPMPPVQATTRAGHALWRIAGGPYLPARALYLTQDLPVIGMTGAILLGVAPAERVAALQGAVAAALALIFGGTLLHLGQRRRALAERLAVEERANALLETRVAERTAELSQANALLTREVTERQEAEAALKRAQAELVQAGKLSALGKMSAGLSHELNQPLMAIRSFAENAALLVERGQPEKAAQNLGRISDLARRMGRIIKNLRAFARQESEPMTDVDLSAVVEAALEIAEPRLRENQVRVLWEAPDRPVLVRGGEVRLQQVVLNLLSNAIDAMAGRIEKRVEIALAPAGVTVALSIRDTGPGIAEPEKIFDPFYTTKEVGAGEGMGLGLSISYGLVQSFGGAIRGRNHPGGGAVFTVELAASEKRKAA